MLRVYLDFLDDHVRNASFLPDDQGLPPEATTLLRSLQRDGAPVDLGGQLLGSATAIAIPVERYDRLAEPRAVIEHLDRIAASIDSDPAAVIASAKELVETACKLILDDLGEPYNQRAELMDLYKTTAKALRVSRDSVPGSAKGSQTAQRILQNLASTVQGLTELRNELGLGHGRAKPSPGLSRHARLSASSARTVVEFLSTHGMCVSPARPLPPPRIEGPRKAYD
jgi:Abortive infection C-terminus